MHVLRYLAKVWEANYKDESSLRIQLNVPNAIVALADELAEYIPKRTVRQKKTTFRIAEGGRHAFLADALASLVLPGNLTLEVLRAVAPNAVATIEAELAASQIDAVALHPALVTLTQVLERPMAHLGAALVTVTPTLATDLANSGSFSSALECWANIGARALLMLGDPKQLATWPRRRLSEGSVDLIVQEELSALRADVTLTTALDASVTGAAAALLAALPASWSVSERIQYQYVWGMRRALRRGRTDPSAAARRLALDIAYSAAAQPLWRTIRPTFGRHGSATHATWSAVDAAADSIGRWLEVKGWIRTPTNHTPLDGLIGDAVRATIVQTVARATAQMVVDGPKSAFMSGVLTWVEQHVSTPSMPDADTADELSASDATLQASLIAHLTAARPLIHRYTRRQLRRLQSGRARVWGSQSAWTLWAKKMHESARRHATAWEYIRWDGFTEAQMRAAIRPLAGAFGADPTFDVVLAVYGVKDVGKGWMSGEQRWYDPHARSFGEDWEGTTSRTEEVHVHQKVSAPSAAAAAERAREQLEATLSATSFALSVGEQITGFRPTEGNWSFTGNRRTGESSWRGVKNRYDSPNLAEGKEIENFAALFGPISDRPPSKRPEVARVLLRGLYWYRSGRWQPDPVRRFLDHFVALEHIFSGGQNGKDERVATSVGQLYGGFGHRGNRFFLNFEPIYRTARSLQDSVLDAVAGSILPITADAAAPVTPLGADWRSNVRPWLSPPFVRAVAAANPPGAIADQWTAHVANLDRLVTAEPNWARADGERAADYRFRIRVLARRRHEIVHEAMTYARGIEYEAKQLTTIVEHVLGNLTDVTLSAPQSVHTVNDWIKTYRAPWVS